MQFGLHRSAFQERYQSIQAGGNAFGIAAAQVAFDGLAQGRAVTYSIMRTIKCAKAAAQASVFNDPNHPARFIPNDCPGGADFKAGRSAALAAYRKFDRTGIFELNNLERPDGLVAPIFGTSLLAQTTVRWAFLTFNADNVVKSSDV